MGAAYKQVLTEFAASLSSFLAGARVPPSAVLTPLRRAGNYSFPAFSSSPKTLARVDARNQK